MTPPRPWHLRARWTRWWHSRLPASDTLALTQRNVYILPTRAGLMLAATVGVLLVGSINYQLNLGYGLTFLLAGSVLAGMHLGHGTLRGLRLSLAAPAPVFAGDAATVAVTLSSQARAPRHAIGLATLAAAAPGPAWAWCEVPAQGRCTVQVAFAPRGRGRHPLPLLTAETRFPLGAFRVWTLWRPAATVLVYPTPEPAPPPLPVGEHGQDPAHARPRQRPDGLGEFDGVRPWRAGDPLRRIAWKKVAQADMLVSRDDPAARPLALWLDLAQARQGGLDLERGLSRLAAWVLQAERLGLDYGLRLPGAQIAPTQGEAHQRQCLEALALC